MTLDEARKIVEGQDFSDPARALEAVAVVLRFHGIADQRLSPIANALEDVARSINGGEPDPGSTGGGAV